jgi:hypothetical protein
MTFTERFKLQLYNKDLFIFNIALQLVFLIIDVIFGTTNTHSDLFVLKFIEIALDILLTSFLLQVFQSLLYAWLGCEEKIFEGMFGGSSSEKKEA